MESDPVAVLMDGAAPRERRVEALRELVSRREARLPELLRAAAAAPQCAELLGVIVRSWGYIGREALDELRPYLAHPDPAVVESAAKAMIAVDAPVAVRAMGPHVRRWRSRTGAAVMRVLAERCAVAARPMVEQLAASGRARHRMVALVFLKKQPAESALPLLFEMYARESNAKVRKVLARVIARRAAPEHVERVRAFGADLAAKGAELQALVARRPADDASKEVELELPASQELAIPAEVRAELARPEPAQAPRPPTPSAPVPLPRLASGSVRRPESAAPAGTPRWIVAAVLIGLGGGGLVASSSGPGRPDAVASPAPAHPLGNVGAPVEVAGAVLSTDDRRGTFELKLTKGGLAEVQVQPGAPAVRAGDAVTVTAVIRRVLPGPRVVLLAFTIKK